MKSTKNIRAENAIFKKFFLANKSYTENYKGSMKPEHTIMENGQVLQDLKAAIHGENNFIQQGVNEIKEQVIELLTKKNEAMDRIVRAQVAKLKLEKEYEEKYAGKAELQQYQL